MKQKVLPLIVLLLTACTAVTPSPAPTVTPPPSATPAPTLTPTATPAPPPTLTPTPTPTLPPQQVGGLEGVPDPRATAPGLFDLRKSDAPIPQFVNAMRMVGIEVNPQEVAGNLRYQTITGVDGRQYVVGSYYLDPDPKKQGETLEGEIPLVIWSEEEGWRKDNLRELVNLSSLVLDHGGLCGILLSIASRREGNHVQTKEIPNPSDRGTTFIPARTHHKGEGKGSHAYPSAHPAALGGRENR